MLVLSRQSGEAILITVPASHWPQTIEVMVSQVVHANKVRIGFTANPEVIIHRKEVAEAIAREGGT
jgi:carbon storage regulator CsrA